MRFSRHALVFAGLIVVCFVGCRPSPPEHEVVTAGQQGLRLARRAVTDGQVHFFTVEHGGKRVNLLVRTDGQGELHTHLDACFSCYRYRKGFRVEGSDLLCIACRYTYPIENPVWEYQGACAPIPIHFTLDDEWLLIERKVLERASRYF